MLDKQLWTTVGPLKSMDGFCADFLSAQVPAQVRNAVWLAAAQLSFALNQGNTRYNLSENKHFFGFEPNAPHPMSPPEAEQWRQDLLQSGVAAPPGEYAPIIIDGYNISFQRYWQYEFNIYQKLLAFNKLKTVDLSMVKALLEAYFQGTHDNAQVDWQRVAVALATQRQLALIHGGPGTGKTTTVTKLLAMLIEYNERTQQPKPRIRLAAPTGKAARRLAESLQSSMNNLTEAQRQRLTDALDHEPATLHRLLGYLPSTDSYKHHADNRLQADIIVIDEASMIDVVLMSKLLDAINAETRLIFLGDRHQLPCVGMGSVLHDITSLCKPAYPEQTQLFIREVCSVELPTESTPCDLGSMLCELKHSHRFQQSSPIGLAAEAIKQGDAPLFLKHLSTYKDGDGLTWLSNEAHETILDRITHRYQTWLSEVEHAHKSPQALVAQFNQYRVLCALREGPLGLAGLNQAIEAGFRKNNVITRQTWYPGKPIAINENDYTLELYNGDVGITLFDEETQSLRVFFPKAGGIVSYMPQRLPAHETAYAMTIHKSQGSEFDRVTLVLPATPSALLTRELLFTGVTRAKHQLEICANPSVLTYALNKHAGRDTNLQRLLHCME